MATLINKKRKTIFIHIPKCAGTTISTVLMKNAPGEWVPSSKIENIDALVSKKIQRNRDKVWSDHARYMDVAAAIGKEEIKDYKVFTATRDPWDRALSTYHFIRRFDGPLIAELLRGMTFSDFLFYYSKVGAAPQVDWLTDETGAIADIDLFDNAEINGRMAEFLLEEFNADVRDTRENVSVRKAKDASSDTDFVGNVAAKIFVTTYERDFSDLGYDRFEKGPKHTRGKGDFPIVSESGFVSEAAFWDSRNLSDDSALTEALGQYRDMREKSTLKLLDLYDASQRRR
ncbi:Sulfotransferase family protein [Salinihabitans flavidus]|uniref:Sulfotransferase family protein n=1 Tax=Salinihabitans flavidus TaxID=569882 RepID=A0A1H8UBW8_9RHOB|nr:sulfotransferase family 2 domain-containing protein [Salinihabitans flavidus]SEP00354.1 Sulfotransferase family protein [Salinihabitans flavidus]